jgi:hypothetical protein
MSKKNSIYAVVKGSLAVIGVISLMILFVSSIWGNPFENDTEIPPSETEVVKESIPESAPKKTITTEAGQSYDIEWNFKEYDFGEIKKGGDGKVTFEFEVKSGTAQITGSRAYCGCTVPEWQPVVLETGEKGSIQVVYDTERMGFFSKKVDIYISRNKEPEVLRITGTVVE